MPVLLHTGLVVANAQRPQLWDHRAEEGHPGRGLEVQDGCTDVLAGECERGVGLRLNLAVPGGVAQRLRQPHRQPGISQDRLHELAGTAAAGVLRVLRSWLRVEDARTHCGVQRADGRAAMLGSGACSRPQQTQPCVVPGLVRRRKVRVVVDMSVDQPQRDEPPVHRVVPLRLHYAHPLLVIQAKGHTGSK